MSTLISIIALFILPMNADLSTTALSTATVSDHVGTWDYVVESPDMTYKGTMELEGEDGEYTGSIKSQGVSINMTDVEIDGDDLTFKMNVQGFPCKAKGTFSGDSFSGTVAVEGFTMPMTAKRAE